MAVNFFTNENSIQNIQTKEQSFGEQSDVGNFEKYNLENKFNVIANAPVFAITKGLLIAIEDALDSNLLNLALLPINSYTAGLPVKLFIYRGVIKSSLINSNNEIPSSDSSWEVNNILDIIKNIQDKINAEEGTPNVTATSDCLGYQFSGLANDTFVEKIFFDNTDDFHPLIVDSGCQIGKFAGDSDLAGVEVVIEKIGNEPQLGIVKSSSHIFEIQKLDLSDPNLTEKEKLSLRFQNRYQKEEILAYIDLAAFYGTCKNQGIRVKGISNDQDNLLPKFYNKNKIYIDIRQEHGFTYNHFFKFSDTLSFGILDNNEVNYSEVNYYLNWPILSIDDISFASGSNKIWLKLPLNMLKEEHELFVSSYTTKFISEIKKSPKYFHVVSNDIDSNNIQLGNSKFLKFSNWKNSNNNAGANYFLLKLVNPVSSEIEDLPMIWNNFFSLGMNNIFGEDQMELGEFSVNTYLGVNSPFMKDIKNGQIYSGISGLAFDKEHVTFFSFKDQILYNPNSSNLFNSLALVKKGKYSINYDPSDYDFDGVQNPNIGFLSLITNSYVFDNFNLGKIKAQSSQNGTMDVLTYRRINNFRNTDDIFESFETISFTKAEYELLKSSHTGDFPTHPTFLKCKEIVKNETENYTYEQITVTLGVPSIIEDEDTGILYVDLINSPTDILFNGLPIKLTSITYE